MRSVNQFACFALLCGAAWIQPVSAAEDRPYTRTIVLIRHGEYLPDPRASRDAGPSLTPLGVTQARLVAARLRSLPFTIDSITSSTMTRAQQTAASVHEMLPTVSTSASPLLSECTPPAAMPLNGASEAQQLDCAKRLDAAFARFLVPATGSDKHDVLVCHGNVIRYFVAKALGTSAVWPKMTVAHASVTTLQVDADSSLRILGVGDVGHVPVNLQSWGSDTDPHLQLPDVGAFLPKH